MVKNPEIFDINPKNWLKPYQKTTLWYLANLIAYETSNSAGGYKTNRGEAYLGKSNVSKMPVSQ